MVAAYRTGKIGHRWCNAADASESPVLRSWHRSLGALLKRAPAAYGWCRTRWSCQALALQVAATRGLRVSRETIRRTLHQLDYRWKRARHVARDDDPQRTQKLARIRHLVETLPRNAAFFFADELDIALLPKLGYEWMRRGTQREVMTPGKNEKSYLAGALNVVTGKLLHVVGERKDRFLFIELLKRIERACPATTCAKIYVVADNYGIHKASAVVAWLAQHPRFEVVWLPSYCPRANPIERAFLDVHDKCTRNHKRTHIAELVGDVVWHLKRNGPWRYKLSEIYNEAEVDRAVIELSAAEKLKAA